MAESPAAGDVSLQDVLRGKPGGAQRSKVSSNMIRAFISSTFTDMSSERKALLDKAYPEVLAFCRSLGLVFEVVDLRWGIRNATSGDHEACELFLQEIQTCKRISAVPAFTAMLGNRYGHRALPRLIPEKQFEVFLSKLSKNPEGIKLLSQWYFKDNNAVPPTYMLQPITAHFAHYSDLRPESGPQRDKDLLRWRLIETQLLKLLRSAATDTEADGHITAEQKQDFYRSVTEHEFEQGLWKDDGQTSSLLFVREIPRQRVRDGPKRLAKFMDVTADGLLDAEAQGLLAALKARLYSTSQKILNLHCVELHKGGIDSKRKEHAQYLESVCEQFVSQMKARISAAVDSPGDVRQSSQQRTVLGNIEEEKEEMSDWVVEEVSHHVDMSAELCEGLQGREGLLGKLCLSMWESTNTRHGPLVVHGATGMGKTALLCKLAQEMRSVLEARAAVVIRLLSIAHPRSFDAEHVLRSLCFQICLAFGLPPPTPLPSDTHLLRCFQDVLEQVSQQGNTLLIILDAVDQLSDRQNAHKLRWLPIDVPPNVHLVVSMDTNSEAFVSMRLRLETLDNFFEVERLSCDEGKQIMDSYLCASQRTLTPEQSDRVLQSFGQTGCPLHLKLILSAAKRWTSFTPLTELRLGANTQEMMKQLFLTLEEKHGKELVGGALGYIALAREGLLEAELRDILSLDDDVIKEAYRYSLPPTPSLIRLPPLLWARLRRDLDHQLKERWTSGVATIAFSSRRLSEAVSARYLTSERRGRSLKILSEYFMGRWAGKLKPVALPGLSLLVSDRKVPPQPLWFTSGLVNVRKLQELPYHLLHAGLWDELRQEVIGSAEWLYCKSRVCGVSSLIQELDQCSQYMDCTETRLVRDALVLIKPSLDFLNGQMDMSLFYTELLARLCSLATPYPSVIGQLCRQCEEWLLSCSEPILIPKCSFLHPPGGALQHTMTGIQGGVVCLDVSLEAELLVTGCDDGVVVVWSLADKQLIHTLLGHTAAVLTIKVIDSSAHCLSLAADGSLRRWSLLNGKQLLCIEEAVPADSAPPSVHLHLSEQLLFIYTGTQVKVWSLGEAEPLLLLSSDEGSVVLGVLNDSVVSLHDSCLVRVSRPGNGAQVLETRLQNPDRCLTVVNSVTLPKRGKVFVVSKDGFLYQISQTGKQTAAEFPLVPTLFSVTKDEKILIAGSDHTLSLFNLDRGVLDKFLELHHDDDVLSACVSSNCRLLASGAADQLIRIWSVTTGALLDTLCGCDAPVSSLIWYKDLVVSASWATACVQLWSLKYDTRHKPTAHIPSGSAHVAITKDCDKIFFVQHQSQKEVISWNQQTGCLSDRLAVSVEVCCLEIAQTKRLLLCGLSTGTVFIYPLALPQETLCIPPPESFCRVLCLAVSPQEKHMAVAYEDSVSLFEITTRDSFPTVEGPLEKFSLSLLHGPLSCMALLSVHRLLYGTGCGEVKLHDFAAGSSSGLESHRSRVTCVTVSNWGTHALVGSEDAVQRLWALKPLGLDHTMEYKGFFFEGVLCAAFSDSDQFVFTGSQDRTIKVWGVSTGNLLFVQYVYSPVVKMVTYRNGFVALSRQGSVIKEVFRCPDHISPDHNPLKNVKAQYRVTSREKSRDGPQTPVSDLQDYNPAQFNLNLMDMLKAKPSPACCVL